MWSQTEAGGPGPSTLIWKVGDGALDPDGSWGVCRLTSASNLQLQVAGSSSERAACTLHVITKAWCPGAASVALAIRRQGPSRDGCVLGRSSASHGQNGACSIHVQLARRSSLSKWLPRRFAWSQKFKLLPGTRDGFRLYRACRSGTKPDPTLRATAASPSTSEHIVFVCVVGKTKRPEAATRSGS